MRRLATVTAPPPSSAAAPAPAAVFVPRVNPWKSPIPYLFGGLALVMLLIAGALLILACSYRKRFRFTDDPSEDGEKEEAAVRVVDMDLVMEPKVLVIMAGDDMPTFLATPATAGSNAPFCCSCPTDERDADQNPSP